MPSLPLVNWNNHYNVIFDDDDDDDDDYDYDDDYDCPIFDDDTNIYIYILICIYIYISLTKSVTTLSVGMTMVSIHLLYNYLPIPLRFVPISIYIYNYWLVVWNINFIFPYIGKNHPNGLSYFSEGLKPPTRYNYWHICPIYQWCIPMVSLYTYYFILVYIYIDDWWLSNFSLHSQVIQTSSGGNFSSHTPSHPPRSAQPSN